MERDTGLRRWLALFLIVQGSSVWASSSSPINRSDAVDARIATAPSAWTSQLGAVDPYMGARGADSEQAPAVWDGAVATFNMISAPRVSHDPSVFVPQAVESESSAFPNALSESIRAATVPAPMAVWLLLAGLVGVVGIARRRNVVRPISRGRALVDAESSEVVSAPL